MIKQLTKLHRKQIRVGPADNAKRMSLDDFDRAIAREGYRYELGNVIIEVSDIPHPSHLAVLNEVRNQLILHRIDNPGSVDSSPVRAKVRC